MAAGARRGLRFHSRRAPTAQAAGSWFSRRNNEQDLIVPDRVSILIPAFNADKWIKQTIDSASQQTWENKEIIIVDDGSSDRTFEIAKKFASKSVKVLTQDNHGASSARNKALALANGDYIQWLDADDLLAPDKITEQMKVAKNGRSDPVLYSSPHAVFYYRTKRARFIPNSLWQDLAPIDWLVINMSENLWMNPAGWLVSQRLTEKAGPWDERLSMDDDGEYFARIVAASERVKFIPAARCFYRQSSFRQVSRDVSEKTLESLFLSATLRIRTLLSLEERDKTKKAGLGLLQAILPFFYPEKADLVQRINALASELGGQLAPPRFGWRSSLFQKWLGPKRGKELMTELRRLRMSAAVHRDKMMHKLGL
jgi:glycosyltransferase involved in cell wall biosynthesis